MTIGKSTRKEQEKSVRQSPSSLASRAASFFSLVGNAVACSASEPITTWLREEKDKKRRKVEQLSNRPPCSVAISFWSPAMTAARPRQHTRTSSRSSRAMTTTHQTPSCRRHRCQAQQSPALPRMMAKLLAELMMTMIERTWVLRPVTETTNTARTEGRETLRSLGEPTLGKKGEKGKTKKKKIRSAALPLPLPRPPAVLDIAFRPLCRRNQLGGLP